MAVPCVWRKLSPLNWKKSSFRIKQSICLRKRVRIGGLLLWNSSYVLHAMFVPSSCGLLCIQAKGHETPPLILRLYLGLSLSAFSMKLIKSVLSLLKDCSSCPATGCGNDEDILSVGNYVHKFVNEIGLTGLKAVTPLDALIDP